VTNKSFMAEGQKLVNDALDPRARTIKILVYSQPDEANRWSKRLPHALSRQAGWCSGKRQVMSSITRRDNPRWWRASRAAVQGLKDVQLGKDETWVALDRVRDPGNLGTIIRTATRPRFGLS